jgi:exopolysaccharide biosynthesis protein
MKIFNKVLCILMAVIILGSSTTFAATSSFNNKSLNGININYVEVNMNNRVKTVVLNAKNQLISTDSLANMAKGVNAFAAINGTYFEAYNGTPVPWGTIIKDGKVLHISNGGSVAGITKDGKLIIDRLSFEFEGYVNDKLRAYPWRINHPSTEPEAITIFTPEYGTVVSLLPDAKAAIVTDGRVSNITTSDFTVPANGFAIVYNSSVTYLLDERFKVGDTASYKINIKTTFTSPEDWNNVVNALGAGPSLIINGVVTADGVAEGFFEDKINKNSAGRSFIGAKADGTIVIGNMNSATLTAAAKACQQMGLVNAMCLDGGYSTALYYPAANVSIGGRNINNGLAFVEIKGMVANPTTSSVVVDGKKIGLDAYNIENSNYFKLRDIAMILSNTSKCFDVQWDNEKNAITLVKNKEYTTVGGELTVSQVKNSKNAYVTNSDIYLQSNRINLKAYNIENNNYFKLRDIAEYIGFEVIWDSATNSILINTK